MNHLPLRYTFIFLIAILAFTSCKDSQKASTSQTEITDVVVANNPIDVDFIVGRWESLNVDKDGFGLWLNVDEKQLVGQYCAINEAATRIDCGEIEDDCYIKSKWPVLGSSIDLIVKSCYSGKTGIASLTIVEDGLLWKLINSPGQYGVDHFAPSETTIIRVHFDPFE